jgi:hypothetical protein
VSFSAFRLWLSNLSFAAEVSKMSSPNIEQELTAITTIIKALDDLDESGRIRVIRYVFDHLKLSTDHFETHSGNVRDQSLLDTQLPTAKEVPQRILDIRTLREEKQPSTDVQMVSLVAYYLAELAPQAMRKDSISAGDVTEFFKQAGYPLPKDARFTLTNARNAGYLDAVGNGQYRLNPVGHNLVVHKMPRAGSEAEAKSARAGRKNRKPAVKARKTNKKR